jgi:hypothetical protein
MLARLFHLLRRSAQLRRRRSSRMAIEAFESRILLSGTPAVAHAPRLVEITGPHAPDPMASMTAAEMMATYNLQYSLEQAFNLSSKPDSNYTIYLDFDGATVSGTLWNDAANPVWNHVGYDIDGDPSTFSNQELALIQRAWQMVAEDFAPFDVNVTTLEPNIEDLINRGSGDSRWGIRVIMTDAFGPGLGTGGVAYLTSFNWNSDTPAYVFNGVRGGGDFNVREMAETISHEVGHALGLNHHGNGANEYYGGHGTGPEGWGPIMGAPFGSTTTQWSNGQYFDANRVQDDLAILTTQNGFTYRPDDYGSTRATATPIVPVNGTNISFNGIIERNTDIDYVRFEAGNGPATFTISTFSERPNLNVFAALYNSEGTLITSSNPSNDPGATLSATLTTGTYYLRIEGVGSHGVYDPATDQVLDPTNPPWMQANPVGFSAYGSLGQYAVVGTVASARADYGDAPDSYGTLEASNGARHLDTGPILGNLRDSELDGFPTATALGDDQNGVDDEDGVVFLNSLTPGRTVQIQLSSITGGYVDAWIDFDGNGRFDPADRILTDHLLGVGTSIVSITVPQNAVIGTSYARFRIAAAPEDVTGPTGPAPNGEVEDYRVSIRPTQVINEVLFNVPGEDTGREYIELRSAPHTVIEPGTYLAVVEGDANGGVVKMVFDLGGLQYGSNGYLVLLQKDSPYKPLIDPAAAIYEAQINGWRDSRITIQGFTEINLEDGSQTYMLLRAPSKPVLGQDIDADNNGTPDGAMFASWDVLDSIGFIDGNAGDQAYGAINFLTNGVGLVPAGSVVVNSGPVPLSYFGRNLNSTGTAAAAWIGGVISTGPGPVWTLSSTTPGIFANRPLDHLGSLNFDQRDYGDLPDSYQTTKTNNGAAHGPGGPIFGLLKDLESNGKPSVLADGDNNSGLSDEDGVTIPALLEGSPTTITIVVSQATTGAVIQAWFDWNRDGDFADAGEYVINQSVSGNGTYTFAITPPIGSFDDTDGFTYARFRISTLGGLGPAGVAPDGEVEDYRVTILTSATDDFGDAPNSYGTNLAANGARHLAVGPTLGLLRDVERDARVSADALGDDNFKEDDEDGVRILTAISPGFTSQVEILAPAGGVLNGWLDWNRNGQFDAAERIFNDVVLTPGLNVLSFAVPAQAQVGATFARFRIAAAVGDVTGPTGRALNGEVEDYRYEILPIFNRPPVLNPAGPFSILENSPNDTVVGLMVASDPDPGQTLTFSITKGNFGGAFKIHPQTGVISVAATEWVDFEIQNVFELEITVTDSGNPALAAKRTVRIDLIDVLDNPSLLVREGEAVGTRIGGLRSSLTGPLTFTILSGNLDGAFAISSEGIVSVANRDPLDFETNPVFELQVLVENGLGGSETLPLTIKVLDRNEAPYFIGREGETNPQFVFQVFQTAPAGTLIGSVPAADPDNHQTVSYAIFSGNESGAFAIDQAGNITLADPSRLNFNNQPIHDLVISVSDNAEVPFTIAGKVRIFVRTYAYVNTFNVGGLGPNFTTTGQTVGIAQLPGMTSPKLVLQQTTAGSQQLSATLDVEFRRFDDLMLQFGRTILSPAATGLVQVSNDGGRTWVTINSFNGAVNPVGVEQQVLINLTVAARNAGLELRGRTQIRWTASTTATGAGVSIDDIRISGRLREATPADVLAYDANSNSFRLGFSNSQQFAFTNSPWFQGGDWVFLYGDFNNDGRIDVAGFNRSPGPDGLVHRWIVGLSTGSALVVQPWTQWNASVEWSNFVVGDFNGDGFDDIAAQTPNGDVWVGYSNGTRFTNQRAFRWNLPMGAQVAVGDVNGDGRDDIIGLQQNEPGTISVGLGGAAGMTLRQNAGNMGFSQWQDLRAGDFNGDGRMDLIARRNEPGTPRDGQLWIGLFQLEPQTFQLQYAARWNNTQPWTNVLVADVNNDGRADLVGIQGNNVWAAVAQPTGSMVNRFLGQVTAGTTHAVAGDFNQDGLTDLATYNSSTRQWLVGLGGAAQLNFVSFGSLIPSSLIRSVGTGRLD